MTTEAQREANRRNAQRSTGPKSADGRSRSSRNALKHGLGRAIALDDEPAPEVMALVAALESVGFERSYATMTVAKAQFYWLQTQEVKRRIVEARIEKLIVADPDFEQASLTAAAIVAESETLRRLSYFERRAQVRLREAFKALNSRQGANPDRLLQRCHPENDADG